MTTSLRRPASDAALTHGFALLGDLLSLLVQRKLGKETHPGIRVSLRSTPLLPVPLRGPAYKGRPCPFTPLAASLRLVPLRNTSTRPTDGEFARMKVSHFRQPGVVGLCTATEQPRRRVDNAACGLSTSLAHGGQRYAVAHPTVQSVIVPILRECMQPQTLRACGTQNFTGGIPTRSMGTIDKHPAHTSEPKRHHNNITAAPKARAGIGSRQEAEWSR
jgi:hypothetical protein